MKCLSIEMGTRLRFLIWLLISVISLSLSVPHYHFVDLCSYSLSLSLYIYIYMIWARTRNCGCLVAWICYQLIAKPGNKTAAVSWPDPYFVDLKLVIKTIVILIVVIVIIIISRFGFINIAHMHVDIKNRHPLVKSLQPIDFHGGGGGGGLISSHTL